MDTERREIRVTPRMVDYYTQPKTEKHLEVIESEAKDRIGPIGHHYGVVRVESHVIGYQKRKLGSREVTDTVYLDLPPTVFETEGIWFTIPEQVLIDADIDPMTAPGALHAAEHAGIAMMPLMAICDRWDIGGLSTSWHPQVGGPTIFIYEAYPGGAGISPVAFRAGRDHLAATLEAVRTCPCSFGCPSCVQSPKCGNGNDPLDKAAAIRLLDTILT
jgi:DEAD/DEAH box helicase domain-containing protein